LDCPLSASSRFIASALLHLNEAIASQERLLTEYPTKLKGAEETKAQIEKLTSQLAEARKNLRRDIVAAAQPGEGSNKKIRDQPRAPDPNLSRAIELAPNLLADYLLAKPKW
jgi:peptidoglycan hydrolase CwlO-like protein